MSTSNEPWRWVSWLAESLSVSQESLLHRIGYRNRLHNLRYAGEESVMTPLIGDSRTWLVLRECRTWLLLWGTVGHDSFLGTVEHDSFLETVGHDSVGTVEHDSFLETVGHDSSHGGQSDMASDGDSRTWILLWGTVGHDSFLGTVGHDSFLGTVGYDSSLGTVGHDSFLGTVWHDSFLRQSDMTRS